MKVPKVIYVTVQTDVGAPVECHATRAKAKRSCIFNEDKVFKYVLAVKRRREEE